MQAGPAIAFNCDVSYLHLQSHLSNSVIEQEDLYEESNEDSSQGDIIDGFGVASKQIINQRRIRGGANDVVSVSRYDGRSDSKAYWEDDASSMRS